MKIFILVMVVCLQVGSASGQAKVSTVHGEIVEVTSYVKDGIRPTSAAGKEIAMANIGRGGSLAILEKGTGKVYIIAAVPNDSILAGRVTGYLGTKTFIKGPVAMRSGVRVITVQDIGKSLK